MSVQPTQIALSAGAHGALGVRRALLVGIAVYQHLNAADFADCDARELALQLKDSGYTDIRTLVNGEATGAAISKAVDELTKCCKPEDTFLFFFAGHGGSFGEKKTPCLFPWETMLFLEPNGHPSFGARTSAMDVSDVVDHLSGVSARYKIILTDACRNNPFPSVRGIGLKVSPENRMTEEYEKGFSPEAVVNAGANRFMKITEAVGVAHACHQGQFAYAWKEKGHGVFCFSILEALRKGNFRPDGFVTFHIFIDDVSKKMDEWSNLSPEAEQQCSSSAEGNPVVCHRRGAAARPPAKPVSEHPGPGEALNALAEWDPRYSPLREIVSSLPLLPGLHFDFAVAARKVKPADSIQIRKNDDVWMEVEVGDGAYVYVFEYGPSPIVFQHVPGLTLPVKMRAGLRTRVPRANAMIQVTENGYTFFLSLATEQPIQFNDSGKYSPEHISLEYDRRAFQRELTSIAEKFKRKTFGAGSWRLVMAQAGV